MIDGRFVVVGAVFGLAGNVQYAWSTLRGTSRPNRVTWSLWTLAPTIGVAAQLTAGVGLPAVLTLSLGVGPAIVLVASFLSPAPAWTLTPFDLACAAVSVCAVVLWLSLDAPVVAIVCAVLADAVGALPTLLKAWRAPATENASSYLLSATNGVVTLLTITRWSVSVWAFPVYATTVGVTIALIVLARTGRPPGSQIPRV